MLQVHNISYAYGASIAVSDASFSADAGQTIALIGHNGAGKSTLMRMLAGLLPADGGHITIDEISLKDSPLKARSKIGYLADIFGLHEDMTARQFLSYIASLRGMSKHEAQKAADRTIDTLAMAEIADKKIKDMSRGMKQKTAIAQSILHQPKVLILDEPGSGLDPTARRDLSDVIKSLNKLGMCIIVSSHILGELEEYCTHILEMKQGRIRQFAAINNDKSNDAPFKIAISSLQNTAHVSNTITSLTGLTPQSIDGDTLHYHITSQKSDIVSLLKQLSAKHDIYNFTATPPRLDQFMETAP